MQASFRDVNVSVTPTSSQGNLHPVRSISEDDLHSGLHGKNANLSCQVPSRPTNLSDVLGGEVFVQSQISSRASTSSSGGFLRGLSSKKKRIPTDAERSYLLNSEPKVTSSPILDNVMSKFGWKRCSSVPVAPTSESFPPVKCLSTPASARTTGEQVKSHKETAKNKVSRSSSEPGQNVFIVRSLSFASGKDHDAPDHTHDKITMVSDIKGDDEEISEDEAVCRVCLEPCEDGNTFKMECSCKGALRLIHEECAVKWFGTRKNKNCDVCGREITNLPVALIRVPSSPRRDNANDLQNRQTPRPSSLSTLQDFMALVVMSTICYFFFLQQLLIQDMKTNKVLFIAPFASTLGFVASLLAVTLAIREYIWTYAALEFAFVAVILCLSYNVFHLVPFYAILLSAVLGFGIAMSLNSLYIHIFAWRVQVTHSEASYI